jgi:tRNA dimethylallyltransferase
MREAAALGRPVVIVGGTGFYLRALTEPLFESPPLDPLRRADLERVFTTMTTGTLRRWCATLDPKRAHLGRTQLMRSVETALLTGHRLSDLHRTRSRASEIRGRYLVVDPGTRLADRIEQRFDLMMADGWTEEVGRLMRTVDESAPAWKASGYSVMREMIAGRIARQEARERVIIETRQYAKRQRTWFRHQLDESATTRVDPDDTGTERLARGWWEEKGRGP